MKLHEHQAKEIFADAGIPVPESRLASSVSEVLDAVDEIGFPAAIKAQVHVGGRGKAGGIKIAGDREEAETYAEEILGMDLKGYTVEKVLVEAGVDFVDELYVGVTMDRGEGKPVAMVSTRGGVNIEEVAEEDPEAIAREHVDPAFGLQPYQARRAVYEAGVDFVDELYVGITMDRGEGKPVAMVSTKGGVNIEEVAAETPEAIAQEHVDPSFGMHPYQARKAVYDAGVPGEHARSVSSILSTLYELYASNDAADIEINPVMITADDEVIAADAVMNIDEDALFRQPELAEMEEASYEDDLERKAGEYGFDYVRLSGNVGVIGNGAGLVMTTLDLVDHYGGTPANFLDVGGGAKADRIANALDMVFSDENVDSVVFNIFGGITRGDEVARGINEALGQFEKIPKPVVVRLAGTNAEEGLEILDTDLVEVEATLEAAVQRAVANAEEVTQ